MLNPNNADEAGTLNCPTSEQQRRGVEGVFFFFKGQLRASAKKHELVAKIAVLLYGSQPNVQHNECFPKILGAAQCREDDLVNIEITGVAYNLKQPLTKGNVYLLADVCKHKIWEARRTVEDFSKAHLLYFHGLFHPDNLFQLDATGSKIIFWPSGCQSLQTKYSISNLSRLHHTDPHFPDNDMDRELLIE